MPSPSAREFRPPDELILSGLKSDEKLEKVVVRPGVRSRSLTSDPKLRSES